MYSGKESNVIRRKGVMKSQNRLSCDIEIQVQASEISQHITPSRKSFVHLFLFPKREVEAPVPNPNIGTDLFAEETPNMAPIRSFESKMMIRTPKLNI
jgi:hypothetical protein